MEERYVSGEAHQAMMEQRAASPRRTRFTSLPVLLGLFALLLLAAFFGGMQYQKQRDANLFNPPDQTGSGPMGGSQSGGGPQMYGGPRSGGPRSGSGPQTQMYRAQ